MKRHNVIALSLALLGLGACRGQPSHEPPVHLNPNMDTQEKYKAQSLSRFFGDQRTMRKPVEGTVAQGLLKEDDIFFRGKDGDVYVARSPVALTPEVLERGHERYDIFCAPCHDLTGAGKGIVATKGLVPPPTYHQDRLRDMPDGELFHVIGNGVRTMPGYKTSLDEADRWAIVAYVRVLQRAQYARLEDIPEDKRTTLQ